ncbi:hypothetical protein CAL29_05270 [Bordetella genomosp. 10]|uniref:Bacterial transcriptional activator domain-containing protein n=1 Tax=Bordetella genomosp. 10 TaxID=1416804 RepID=A0A261SLA6_9BORD|nr:AAA family ATPase [Bordetella genomosp. 10]OZI37787.1 hypothetical protein CAL29_05270 [Bordetella genomosp. 10]
MSPLQTKPIVIQLLGGFSIRVDGVDRTEEIGYSKPKHLLAVLALAHERVWSRAALSDLLWPHGNGDGRANLRQALCVLRRVLAPAASALLATSGTVALDFRLVEVDAMVLLGMGDYGSTPLKDRLVFDRGDLLEHLPPVAGTGLHAWRISWQSRLAQEVSRCRQQYLLSLTRRGAIDEALAGARKWVSLHPGDELAHRNLIRLLRDAGSREAALRAYEHCAAVMGEYYETEPSAETRALLQTGAPVRETPAAPAHTQGPWAAGPVAILALAVSQDDDGRSRCAADRLQNTREHLLQLVSGRGGLVSAGADGSISVTFGYPESCESPADVAARLACDLRRFAPPANAILGMGIHADLAAQEGDSADGAIMLIGQRAIRLAYLAGKGETLVSDAANAQLHDRYVITPEERYGLRVGVLDCVAEAPPVHRMFGRAAEFDILVRRWSEIAATGRGRTLLLHGERGVGKTLLMSVFSEYARRAGGAVRMLECRQENRQRCLHPLYDYLLRHVLDAAGPAALALSEADKAVARLVESLGYRAGLDRHTSASVHEQVLRPAPLRQRSQRGGAGPTEGVLHAVTALLLQRERAGQPLLLVIDSLQWADAATRELTARLARLVETAPVMLMLVARGPSAELPAAIAVHVEPLSSAAMVELVSARARGKRLAPKIRRHIVEGACGIPWRAEQMVRDFPLDGGEADLAAPDACDPADGGAGNRSRAVSSLNLD